MELVSIRAEIERLDGEISDLLRQRDTLDAKIKPKQQERDYWAGIESLRKVSNGNGEVISPANLSRLIQKRDYGKKAKAMRAFMLSRNGEGVRMPELIAEATRLGAMKQFAYQWSTRQRNKKPPTLEKRRGKFYATEHLSLE